MNMTRAALCAVLAFAAAPTAALSQTAPAKGHAVAAPGAPASTPEQTDAARPSTNLIDFLEGHFERVGTSCLPDISRNRRWWPPFRSSTPSAPLSYIPSDIRQWSTLEGHMNLPVEVRTTQSMNSVFAEVFLRGADGKIIRRVGQEIGVTSGAPSDPILYEQVSNARREHNCVTLLGGNASVTASLPVASLRSALEATTTRQDSQTIFLYGGVMVSPITATLGLNTTTVEAPSGLSPFAVGMTIWKWYQQHRLEIPPEDGQELVIRNQVEGVALYRVTGLTQSTLLSATGSSGIALPLFGARAEASASANNEIRSLRRDYAAAFWEGENTSYARLPPPAVIVQQVQASAVFTPVIVQGVAVNGREPMDFSADLADLPPAYCKTSFWTLDPAATADPSLGENVSLAVAPVVGQPWRCRFTAGVKPSAGDTPSPSMGVVIAVRTRDGMSPVENIVLRSPRINVPDFRADIALAPGAGASAVSFPANGEPSPLLIAYEVRTQAGRKVSTIGETALVNLTCGGVARSLLLRRDTDIRLTEAGTVVEVTLRLPANAIPAAASSGIPCSLEGEVRLRPKDNAELTARLPTYTFTADRLAARPTPAAAPGAGAGPVPPG